MLRRIEIRGFRSCRNVVIDDISPVTVLVGRNAVGKSNILRAIQWAANTATVSYIDEITADACSVALRFDVESATFDYFLRLLPTNTDPDRRPGGNLSERLVSFDRHYVILERENERAVLWPRDTRTRTINVGRYAPCIPALIALLPLDSDALSVMRPLSLALRRIRYYPLNDEAEDYDISIVSNETYDTWLTQFRRTGDPGANVLLRLMHMSLAMPEQWDELRSLLGPNGLGIVDDIRVEPLWTHFGAATLKDSQFHSVDFMPSSIGQRYLKYRDLSEGTRRVIRILLALLFDRPSVMLLEHPEDTIHPGLLRKLISLLRTYSDETQVIIASHSPAVFNSLEPGSVRLVTLEEGETKVRPLSPEETSIAGRYLEEEGSLADFLETVEEA
jgi:predicted ATPase